MGYRLPSPQIPLSEKVRDLQTLLQRQTDEQQVGDLVNDPFLKAYDMDVYSFPEKNKGGNPPVKQKQQPKKLPEIPIDPKTGSKAHYKLTAKDKALKSEFPVDDLGNALPRKGKYNYADSAQDLNNDLIYRDYLNPRPAMKIQDGKKKINIPALNPKQRLDRMNTAGLMADRMESATRGSEILSPSDSQTPEDLKTDQLPIPDSPVQGKLPIPQNPIPPVPAAADAPKTEKIAIEKDGTVIAPFKKEAHKTGRQFTEEKKTHTRAGLVEKAINDFQDNIAANKAKQESMYAEIPESSPEGAAKAMGVAEMKRNEDLSEALQKHTAGMTRNQELAFWDRIVGALGKIAAGGIGYATGLGVGGAYKEPEPLFDEAKMNQATAQEYNAKVGTSGEQYKARKDYLDNIRKLAETYGISEKDMNSFIAQMNALSRQDYTKTTDKAYEEELTGWEQRALQNMDNRQRRGDDEVRGLNFDKFIKSTSDVAINLNKNGVKWAEIEDPKEFANTIAEYTTPIDPTRAVYVTSINPDGILARYKELEPQFGPDPKNIQKRIVAEMRAIAGAHFGDVAKNSTEAGRIATQYGFNVDLITPAKRGEGSIFGGGNLGQKTTDNAPASEVKSAKSSAGKVKLKVPNSEEIVLVDPKHVDYYVNTEKYSRVK